MNIKDSATALWITGESLSELRETSLAPPAADEVQIKTLYSGISRGTETLVFAGRVPVSEHERMRAPFQEGDFPYPVKYGYINVGLIERGPKALVGRTAFTLYAHQTYFNISSSAVTLLPEGVPAERAVLAANMETAINALWDAQPSIGDKISVVGAGVVGALVAYLASRIIGCEVQLIDINADRLELANTLGVAFTTPDKAIGEQDLVIHASASEQGLKSAIELAGFEAKVVELSWYGDRAISVNLGGSFHSQRLHLKSSQVGQIAMANRSRWDYKRRLQFALTQLEAPCLDILISGETDFRDLPDTMKKLSEPGNTSLCHRIRY